ncbi:MAG: 16S rRNA (cytosine(1402)-N(4))-methyltransferase RsmH [Bacteroidales bacterium]|nr:16S rRNA (cytosine(1402)-N(4))-methyltransferase RsmH [Bacteroidales bacterium]MCM1416898.1 16S rRNA (cytosine(1402)-N(4))-methyltransferase RsmH [bacterium]MCM1424908.1 16S rRNA (cytosine(1402)-N(4))-methyltransferase RsmH [bacterium]
MEFQHTPVLLNETIENLDIKPAGVYLDGTLGGGGHAFEVAKRLTGGRLIGIDQDEDAIAAAGERLSPYRDKVTLVRDNYVNAAQILCGMGITRVDGILLDLGVSSFQLDREERGFSYRYDAALDMRMDKRQSFSAKEIVNGYSEAELYRVIRDYGEEQFAKNIAKHIAAARRDKPIETTGALNEIIKAAIPAKMRAVGGHPSKRTFQALRIECNRELEVLTTALDELAGILSPGGRFCVITFHSLEDRIVKNAFRRHENPCTCPPDFPVCVCGKTSQGRVVTKKPILPSERELSENKRAASAKLRVFEKR